MARVLRVTTRLTSLRSLRRDQDVRRCGQEGAAGEHGGTSPASAQHPPRDWRHWLRLSIEQPLARWGVRQQHSPVWVTRPETTPGLQSPWKLSVATEVTASELDSSEVFGLGLELVTRMFYPELSPAMRWHLDQGQKMYNMQMFSQQFSDKFSDQYGESYSSLPYLTCL